MVAFAAFPGFFFSFAAMGLLVVVSVSVPIWTKVDFLHATLNSERLIFGNWGYCLGGTCTSSTLGYKLQGTVQQLLEENYNASILSNLTYALILNPIGAGLSGLAALFGLLGVFSTSRAMTILMTIASLLALIVTGVSFILSMVLFGLARSRLNDVGANAMFGNGEWMILGAFVSLILGTCFSLCGSCGRFRRNNDYTTKY